MPWNPMRVEQRIDRLGQRFPRIRIVNLQYDDTVETDVYRTLRGRIRLFESVVGKLQPILARLSGAIGEAVLRGGEHALAADITGQLVQAEAQGFDLESAIDDDASVPDGPNSPLTMDHLDKILRSPDLIPPATRVRPLQQREHAIRIPAVLHEVRVTTDVSYYEEHSDALELWSPGGVAFTRL